MSRPGAAGERHGPGGGEPGARAARASGAAARVEAARGRLVEAGAALAARPAAEVLDALCRALDAWADPASPWRARLLAELPGATGFSEEAVAEGLARGLRDWSGEALRALVARELGHPARLDAADGVLAVSGFPLTSVLLAGAIPMPTLLSLLLPLVLRSPVLAKSAARDPVTPELVAASIAAADPVLGRSVEVVHFESSDRAAARAFLDAGCVVATGSDETVAAVRALAPPSARLVSYGHRLSAVALGPEVARRGAVEDVAGRVALDVALWDQLGCLSPVAVFVEDAGEGGPERLAEALAGALERLEQRLPRGELGTEAAAAVRRERAEAEMRAAAGRAVRVWAGPDSLFTVVLEDGARMRPAPLHRFVRVHPVAGPDALLAALAPLSSHLAALAVEGFAEATGAFRRALARSGASRLCRPGAMQSPPLGWHHDGGPLLLPLARLADREL